MSSRKRIRFITTTIPCLFLVVLIILSGCSMLVPQIKASLAIVYADPSDGHIRSDGMVADSVDFYGPGDDSSNNYFQAFVKFSLSGISGTLSSAMLNLYVHRSNKDDTFYDPPSPLTNPGLGDLLVIHIADYGPTLSSGALNAPSIGNDPGVLISGTANPIAGYFSIDVRAGMQDDMDHGRSFTPFMIKLAINTDNDGKWDRWIIASSEYIYTDRDPFLEYTLVAPVGGVAISVNKLEILAPYLALVGLVGAVAAVSLRRRRNS